MFASGAVIGLSIGGTIIQHFGWQATFFTIILISISLLIVIWRFIRVTQNEYPEKHRLQLNSRKDNNYNTKMSSSTMIDIKGAHFYCTYVTADRHQLFLNSAGGWVLNSGSCLAFVIYNSREKSSITSD
jgi:predicted MFS family arabinose efflux permease